MAYAKLTELVHLIVPRPKLLDCQPSGAYAMATDTRVTAVVVSHVML
jgi:hypothetical protein